MSKYILGIDAGTSIVKCCIMDMEGNELGTANRKIPITVPNPNWAEEDMWKIWVGVTEIIPEVLATTGVKAEEIIGVGVTGQGDGSWLIDKDGNPVGDAILWTDGRAGEIVNNWMKDGIVNKAYDYTGTGPYAGSTNAVLRWRVLNQPDVLQKAYKNIWCMDWVEYKLTGVISTDESDPSLFGLDIKARTWSDEVLKMYGLDSIKHLLPDIVQSMQILGNITAEAAAATGLKEGTPVVKGMFDVVASATGVGAVNAGDACTILGTTCFNEAIFSEPAFEPRNVGMSICHGVPGLWLKAMGVNYGTPNLDWFIREFGAPYKAEAEKRGVNVFQVLSEVIEKTPAGSNGVIYSPYLCPGGERAPFVKPEARAQFFGITEESTRDDMLRAVYEGVGLASWCPTSPSATRTKSWS
ncbi:MAG: FGGY family carbohydrate kinase [Bacillota bacterium]